MVPKPNWRSVQGNKIACQKCLTIFFPPRVPPGGRRFNIFHQNSEHIKPITESAIVPNRTVGFVSTQYSIRNNNIVKLKIKIISPSPQGSETTIRSNSRSQTSSWNFISSSQHLDCAFHLKTCLSSCTHNTRAKNRGRFILSLSSISFLHKSYSKKNNNNKVIVSNQCWNSCCSWFPHSKKP